MHSSTIPGPSFQHRKPTTSSHASAHQSAHQITSAHNGVAHHCNSPMRRPRLRLIGEEFAKRGDGAQRGHGVEKCNWVRQQRRRWRVVTPEQRLQYRGTPTRVVAIAMDEPRELRRSGRVKDES